MLDAGMLDLVPDSVAAREEVGVFAVWKKDGRQKLVLDCRASKFYFEDPEHVELSTEASVACLVLPEGEGLW
eukprot:3063205-Pyramimonas_sp.AAC.1